MDAEYTYHRQLKHDYFDTTISREFFDMFCGAPIGYGITRVVYDYVPDPTCVIKIEAADGLFQNVHEWDLYKQYKNAGSCHARWLAPCVKISSNGIILIQKKATPVPYTMKLPKKIPRFLSDLKRENFGIYQKRLVCMDYGRHDAVHASSGIMKKAEWLNAVDGHFRRFYSGARS